MSSGNVRIPVVDGWAVTFGIATRGLGVALRFLCAHYRIKLSYLFVIVFIHCCSNLLAP